MDDVVVGLKLGPSFFEPALDFTKRFLKGDSHADMEWAANRASNNGQATRSDMGDGKTFEKRVWRRSIPVIHLAASYACLMKSNEDRQATFLDLVWDEAIFRDFIKLAEQLRPLGPRIRPGSIRTEAVWDISWIA